MPAERGERRERQREKKKKQRYYRPTGPKARGAGEGQVGGAASAGVGRDERHVCCLALDVQKVMLVEQPIQMLREKLPGVVPDADPEELPGQVPLAVRHEELEPRVLRR